MDNWGVIFYFGCFAVYLAVVFFAAAKHYIGRRKERRLGHLDSSKP